MHKKGNLSFSFYYGTKGPKLTRWSILDLHGKLMKQRMIISHHLSGGSMAVVTKKPLFKLEKTRSARFSGLCKSEIYLADKIECILVHLRPDAHFI